MASLVGLYRFARIHLPKIEDRRGGEFSVTVEDANGE